MEAAELEAGLVALATERCRAVDVDVRWLGIDPARLDGPGRAVWDGDPCRPRPTLELWWTVPVGSDHYTVRPELVVWVEAPIAAAPAQRGEPVVSRMARVPLSALAGGPFSGPGVARRALAVGDPLTNFTVAPAPDVWSGAAVTLRVRSGALEIRSEAKLLEHGRVGERVRVWVAATDTSVSGVLSAPNLVDL